MGREVLVGRAILVGRSPVIGRTLTVGALTMGTLVPRVAPEMRRSLVERERVLLAIVVLVIVGVLMVRALRVSLVMRWTSVMLLLLRRLAPFIHEITYLVV